MATRLTYTSGTRTHELDAAFEACLAAAREDTRDPLAHLVAGGERDDGPELVREDPSRTGAGASRARQAPAGPLGEAGAPAAPAARGGGARAPAARRARPRAAAPA